ncbi:CheR family methyltransferase [Achromobacter piechaudii]|uniref:histidine kinase n=1 Tax=Achromobacter piechaudii TaxID=72556 RepID=A0ABN7FBH4_9BURK|nr:CheR family methyltransferase [Achromobacter piechaudii]CAB3739492.1 Protein-glutamate methylesterase/protein-glutamine glutaminase [Achromobacter piechaudii]CAB3919010.1 Protein-glutamate methylesterase/protein-glutamine glutaminase [Achromobacter piechaudii]CAB3958830.1 Protein-glutamate methylesterase/protein-glutamine glutaminase [Achromobacter piechaudii]
MALSSAAFVVGIGASAGGVEALEGFFAGIPKNPDMSFIVVTHLGPGRESHLPDVIGRHTSLPVHAVQDDMPIETNQIYVLASDADVSVSQGHIKLAATSGQRHGRRPIDQFLTSLAKDYGQRAVGIVLSGSDTDGTLGLKAIKEYGGITMAQAPNGNGPAYTEMPRSAISAGIIDFALPVAEMGTRLHLLDAAPPSPLDLLTADDDAQDLPAEIEQTKSEIYGLLLTRTGHDFSGYKSKTFLRRVHRRMKVNQTETLPAYLAFLRDTPQEAGALFRDLLISVTDFFRDPDAFEALAQLVVPKLLEGRSVGDTVRVWVPGCATGEEVYSLAILLREQMDKMEMPPRVQLFATDIDERALNIARTARYPGTLLDSVSPERRERFFIADGESYLVSKQIRELCIFSPHSVLRDPPFSRIDLVSCRNLLIYFGGDIQKQVFPTFHYALRNGGYLFLGMSENTTQFSDMFGALDKQHRIFQRRSDIAVRPRPHFNLPPPGREGPQDFLQRRLPASGTGLRQSIDTQVLLQHAPPHVLVNKDGDVVYYSARTGKYLEAAAGVPTRQILALARKDLRLDLRALLNDAMSTGASATRHNVAIEGDDGRVQLLRLTVDPLLENHEGEPLFLVLFADDGPPVSREEANAYLHASHIGAAEQIESELRETRDRLQSTIEEYETALEELKSSNEELVSVNEELQSSNEELEASKEELVSLNEELHTVNAELQGKVDELDRSNSDLHNLFASTAFATLFLDGNLVIRSFTPPVCDVFRILPSDRGRPITDLASRIPLPSFAQDIKQVFRDREVIERRIEGEGDANHYLLRLAPYRDANNRVDGVVVTFIDITQITQAEQRHRILIAELQHRTRNLLALVQSIAYRTLGRGEPFERLDSRLSALSRVQGLLSDVSHEAVDFGEIVRRELDAVGHGQHVSVHGEQTFVSAECSQSLALALHELGTNALKHGALKHDNGKLQVQWHTLTREDGQILVVDWQESGLPTPPDTSRKGYGRELIEQALTFTLQAQTSLDFQADGLRCRIEVPLRSSGSLATASQQKAHHG